MKPLAYLMRPTKFSDIVGQDRLVGENGVITRMIKNNSLRSFILYGNPGCGKTTIAESTCKETGYPWHRFNASTDNKDVLKQIMNESRFVNNSIVIIDEIHRMKKDIQDYLLPFVEDGTIIMIGLTTNNPYHSINPAIRSRCLIYKLNDLQKGDLQKILDKAYQLIGNNKLIDKEVYDYIINISNGEIRTLINSFETLVNISSDHITLDEAIATCQKANVSIDGSTDSYYDTLSGLQKSIRGSDVDASLHYLSKLIIAGDFDSLGRRLLAIAYEDIGLANPGIGVRVKAAVDAAKELGNPEAKLPLSVVVIEMALSPKSNSAYLAIDKAMTDIENGKSSNLPIHLKNTYSFDPSKKPYLYPHDYPNSWVYQQYLPDSLIGVKYYQPKPTSKSEISLYNRYMQIEEFKKNAKNNKKA